MCHDNIEKVIDIVEHCDTPSRSLTTALHCPAKSLERSITMLPYRVPSGPAFADIVANGFTVVCDGAAGRSNQTL